MKTSSRLVGALLFLIGCGTAVRAAELAWLELMTSGSPAAAASFYEKTLGWTSEPRGEGDWATVVLSRGGRPVAGAVHRAGERMARARTRWVGFFAAPELGERELAGVIEAAGGHVLEAEHAGAASGAKLALLTDREGAAFGLWRPQEGAMPGAAATGFWPVMLAHDTVAAVQFYRELLGGEFRSESRTPLFAGDFLLTKRDAAWAGVQPTGVDGRAGWLFLIGVADIDATVKTARKEGARVLREPRVDLIGGRVAVLADPMGGVFGLYELFPARGAVSNGGARSPAASYEVEALSR